MRKDGSKLLGLDNCNNGINNNRDGKYSETRKEVRYFFIVILNAQISLPTSLSLPLPPL